MLRKALLRVSIVVAVVGGIMGATAGSANAMPPWVACHHELSPYGTEELCLLNDPSWDYSQILYFRNAGGMSEIEVGQGHDWPFVLTGANVQWEHLARVVAVNEGGPHQKALLAGVDLHNRDLGGQHLGVNLGVFNTSGGDAGVIEAYETFTPGGSVLTFAWTNGACGVFHNGDYVAPCAIVIVPKVPLLPYVPLP